MNTPKAFNRTKISKGFTLIELMIAIAIVGVLATIAIPQFTDYLGRARVSEAVNLAQGCKTGFVEFNASRGLFPGDAAQAGCNNTATENVASLVVTGDNDPRITVELVTAAPVPPAVQGHMIVLQPLADISKKASAGQVIANWRCSVTDSEGNEAAQAALNMVPTACRQAPI